MQPDNDPDAPQLTRPATEDDSQPTSPPRTTLVIAIVLVIATVFVGAVVGGVMWLSGNWSGPSDSDPAESVDGFLTALLNDRDAQAAAGFTCASGAGDLSQALDLLDGLPKPGEGGGMANFSWEPPVVESRKPALAVVTAEVVLDITGDSATWTFALVTGDPDDAWRVCGIDTGAKSG